MLGSLRPSSREASVRHGAIALGLLSVAMMVFVLSPVLWLSVLGAATAGVACLLAGATLRTLLLHYAGGPARQTAVMAAWAVAWAGSKPIASFTDGTLGGLRLPAHRTHARATRPAARSRLGPPAVPGPTTRRPPGLESTG